MAEKKNKKTEEKKDQAVRRVCIQGTWYELIETSPEGDPILTNVRVGGYCDVNTRRLVVDKMEPDKDNPQDKEKNELIKKSIIRRELLRAFFYECGLGDRSWANNEEMLEFLSIQFPKIASMFSDARVFNFYLTGAQDGDKIKPTFHVSQDTY